MTSDEKTTIKQIKEELVVIKLSMKVITEKEFRRGLDRALRLIDELTGEKCNN